MELISFKHGLTEVDWYINIDHLMGKIVFTVSKVYFMYVLIELCAIRDNIKTCDIASITNSTDSTNSTDIIS